MHVIFHTGFPVQDVNPITEEGVATAGNSNYTLICNVTKEPDLPDAATLAIEWLDPSGSVIDNEANFTVSETGPTFDDELTSHLTFNSLYTSQAGEYTCRTLQTIPGIVNNHAVQVSFSVQVKCKLLYQLTLLDNV